MSKKITVVNEKWFTTAPIAEVVALALRHLDVPATSLDGKEEHQQRTLIRQVFKQREQFDFGDEFDISEENSNPFKKRLPGQRAVRKSVPLSELSGKYQVVKCRMRASDNDPKWELWGDIATHTVFEELFEVFKTKYGDKRFNSTGALTFTPKEFAQWALKCGWIVRC